MKQYMTQTGALEYLHAVCNRWEDEVLAPLDLLTHDRTTLPTTHEYWKKKQEAIEFYAPDLVEALGNQELPEEEKAEWIFSVYQDLLNVYGGRKESAIGLDSAYYPRRREFILSIMTEIM
jgi:hypothetical protein